MDPNALLEAIRKDLAVISEEDRRMYGAAERVIENFRALDDLCEEGKLPDEWRGDGSPKTFHVLIPHEVSYQAVEVQARNAKEAARLVRSESAGTYLDDVYDYGHLVEVPVLIKDLATGAVTFVEDDEDEDEDDE